MTDWFKQILDAKFHNHTSGIHPERVREREASRFESDVLTNNSQ